MSHASIISLKSTIGRTDNQIAHRYGVDAHDAVARRRCPCHLVHAALAWLRDPLGIGANLEGWYLNDEEIRADLEYGRD